MPTVIETEALKDPEAWIHNTGWLILCESERILTLNLHRPQIDRKQIGY